MSTSFRVSEHISRPVDEVWTSLTDWNSANRWMPGIDEMHVNSNGPIGEGTQLAFHARGAVRESEIVTWSPPHQVALRSRQGGVTATYEYTCKPDADGTRLTLHARCDTRGLIWVIAGPLIRYLVKRTDAGQVIAFKKLMESHSEDASSVHS